MWPLNGTIGKCSLFPGHGISSDVRDFWPQETALSIQKTSVPLKPISDCFSAIPALWWPCPEQSLNSGRIWPAPQGSCTALNSLSAWHSSQPSWKLHSSKESLCCYFFPLPAPPLALAFLTVSPATPASPGARAGSRSFERGERKHSGSRLTQWSHH